MSEVHERNLKEGKYLCIYLNKEDKPGFQSQDKLPQQTDCSKFVKFRKPKLNMFWQQVRPFSAQLDTMLNATFCSTGTGNILMPASRKRSREQSQSSSLWLAPSFTMLCFPTVQDSLCQASHWGWTSSLVIQGEHGTRGQAKTWNVIQHVSLP